MSAYTGRARPDYGNRGVARPQRGRSYARRPTNPWMSVPQNGYIRLLLDQRQVPPQHAQRLLGLLKNHEAIEVDVAAGKLPQNAPRITNELAQQTIGWLKRQPYQSLAQQDAPRRKSTDELVPPGVYRHDGRIYVVVLTKPREGRRQQYPYAKEFVRLDAPRLNRKGEQVKFEYVYRKGAIDLLEPEDLVPLDDEDIRALMIEYGHCLYCGRRLKDGKSVANLVGPDCAKKFGVARRNPPKAGQLPLTEAS